MDRMDRLKTAVLCDEKIFHEQYERIFGQFIIEKSSKSSIATGNINESYWALFAKFIYRCPPDAIRKLQQRLQARLIESCRCADASQHPSLGLMHFVEALLEKCPMLIQNNQSLLTELSYRLIDYVCGQWSIDIIDRRCTLTENELPIRDSSTSSPLYTLATRIYFRVFQFREEARILNTTYTLMRESPPFANLRDLLPMENIKNIMGGVNSPQQAIASFLWLLYAKLIKLADAGTAFDIEHFIRSFEASISLGDSITREEAIGALLSLVEATGLEFVRVSKRLSALLITNTTEKDELCMRTLRTLNDSLGISSGVHTYFDRFAEQLIKHLHNNDKPSMELVELVISVMKTSLPLLSANHLNELQMVVCLKAMSWLPSLQVLRLLNALIELNHDQVPLPIEIAQSVFGGDRWPTLWWDANAELRMEVEKGQALCNIYCRPKIAPTAVIDAINVTIAADARHQMPIDDADSNTRDGAIHGKDSTSSLPDGENRRKSTEADDSPASGREMSWESSDSSEPTVVASTSGSYGSVDFGSYGNRAMPLSKQKQQKTTPDSTGRKRAKQVKQEASAAKIGVDSDDSDVQVLSDYGEYNDGGDISLSEILEQFDPTPK